MPGTQLVAPLVGGAAKRIGGWLGRKLGKKAAKKAIVAVGSAVAIDQVISRTTGSAGGGGGIKFPTSLSPFEPGRGLFGPSGGGGRVQAGEMGACPSGYHLNKHRLSDGTPARSVCVRNRSMNFANGRAARRAGRRLRGTVKMLKKSFSFVSARPPKGKFIVRKK